MSGESAGSSAFREYERRRANELAAIDVQRSRVKERFGGGRIGSAIAAVTVDDSVKASTHVWKQGAIGEQKVAQVLDGLAGAELIALHDRKLPKSRANFDHLVVTPSGVWVIDAKRYIGKRPERYQEGGFFSAASVGLKVGGRKRDSLIDGILRQVDQVQTVAGENVPVRGALCFVDSDWPVFGGSFAVRGVEVLWPKRLPKLLQQSSDFKLNVQEIAALLSQKFVPA